MNPVSFTIDGDIERFHYRFRDLRDFVRYAHEGTAGYMLVWRDKKMVHYRVSGTLDRPRPAKRMKDLYWFHMQRETPFLPQKTAEQICTPSKILPLKDFGIYVPDGMGGVKKL